MSKRVLITLAAALLAVCACQQPKLVILHTNDTHSHFEPVRGGQYDGLMRRMGRKDRAIGFAVFLNRLERLREGESHA